MGAQVEANVVGTELEKVRPKVPILFDNDTLFYGSIEKRDVEVVSNREMRVPLQLEAGGYFGHYNPDGGPLGRGSAAKYDKATLSPVHLRYAVELTKLSEWSTNSPKKAVINSLKRTLAKTMANFRRHVEAASMTAGNGQLAVASAVTPADPDVVTLGTDGFGAKLLRPQQKGTWYEPDLSAPIDPAHTNVEITFLDYATKIIKTSPQTTGLAAADVFLLEGLSGASPTSLFGVPYHHNSAATGTWLGLNRANIPQIRANRVNAAGAGLTLSFARRALNAIGDRLGIDHYENCVAWMHPAQVQAYEELGQLVSLIQKTAKDEALDLYFGDKMQMAGAPIRKSYMWDKTRIDFVDKSVWGRAELKPAGFYEEQGRTHFEVRSADGGVAAALLFYIVCSFQFFIDNPPACSYVDGLKVPTGY